MEPNNYRPTALTKIVSEYDQEIPQSQTADNPVAPSCLCKTLERMINKRFTWFLESYNHISRFQSGFRSDCSTTDDLVRFETFISDVFIKKEHVVAVFFIWKKLMIQHGDAAF